MKHRIGRADPALDACRTPCPSHGMIEPMGKTYPQITDRLRAFIEEQPVFFVATAPLAADGHINVSPKGRSGTLRVLDGHTLAFLDFGGSHAESTAHVRENGRITLMWCAFTGPPTIVRVHGTAEVVFRDDPRFTDLVAGFGAADGPGLRAVFLVTADLISDTCGFAVPLLDYVGERTQHAEFFGRKTDEEFIAYAAAKEHNRTSIDGLPAVPQPMPARAVDGDFPSR